MRVLVTGASGFIGSFIVSTGLDRGYEMWAGIRATSSKQYLTDPAIHFAELDLGNRERLREQLLAYKAEMGGAWDYVIHAAGATKSLHREGFKEAIVMVHNNVTRVVCGEYATEVEAHRHLGRFYSKPEYSEAWIYKKVDVVNPEP